MVTELTHKDLATYQVWSGSIQKSHDTMKSMALLFRCFIIAEGLSLPTPGMSECLFGMCPDSEKERITYTMQICMT